MTRSKKNPAWTLEYSSDGMFRSVWTHDLYLRIHTPNLIEFAYKNQASIQKVIGKNNLSGVCIFTKIVNQEHNSHYSQ